MTSPHISSSETLMAELQDRVLTLTLNRPEKLNALNIALIDELHRALEAAASNPEVGVVIVTGSGSKAFVAGADISEFAHFTPEQGKQLSAEGHRKLFSYVEQFPKPVIAAINGFALGGGLELALGCHIRVASETAKLGFPELNLGVIPGYGGTQRLAHLVGKGKALEMILTTDMVTAAEAHRLGLVNHVVAPENLLPFCMEMAKKMAAKSPLALRTALTTILAGYAHSQGGLETEIEAFGACFGTEDFKEGVSAFLEKRKAVFTGK